MTAAQLIRLVRRRRGLTQAELARRAGTSQPVVSAYEHGRRDPTLGTLARLVEAAGERLRIDATPPVSDLPPPVSVEEHAQRLLAVLSLADAVPTRRRAATLRAPAHGLDVNSATLTLAERIVAIDTALVAIPHAFGGAIALAYYAEPRATIDIDLNVFVGVERFDDVALPLGNLGASVDDPAVAEHVRRDGQARLFWDATPIDLFFAYDAFHAAAARATRIVPFASTSIAILSAEHLIACKAVFDRAKDWVDIDAMLAAGTTVDVAEVLRWVGRVAGDTDRRYNRIAAVLTAR